MPMTSTCPRCCLRWDGDVYEPHECAPHLRLLAERLRQLLASVPVDALDVKLRDDIQGVLSETEPLAHYYFCGTRRLRGELTPEELRQASGLARVDKPRGAWWGRLWA